MLSKITNDFEIKPSDFDESKIPELSASDVATFLATKKAMNTDYKDCVIIGCDTVVILDEEILGKPKDEDDAFKMLSKLSGKKHFVETGVCLKYNDKTFSFSEITQVEFYHLTMNEINEYIASGEPFDKAGGYGIQGDGALFVKGIFGDYYNVVGLPIARLKRELESFLRGI